MLSSFLKLTAPPKNGFRQKYIEEKKLILELETHIAGIQQKSIHMYRFFLLYVCLHTTHMSHVLGGPKGVIEPGNTIISSFEPSSGCWQLKLEPLVL